MIVKSYDKRRWLLKERHMSNTIANEYLTGDLSDLEGSTITFEHHFENQIYLAHNHWLGILRITHPWGYNQYLVSVAAGKDTAFERIRERMLKELVDAGLNFEKNDVKFLRPEDAELIEERMYA